jgi:hypothetical protein
VSFGTQDSEEGYVSQCPLLIPQRFLVLHSRDHMETDSKILGRSASPSSGAHEDLGIAFPFLITHILRKKGIKGTAADGPITKSPHFGQIQWNQSCSYMPRVAQLTHINKQS